MTMTVTKVLPALDYQPEFNWKLLSRKEMRIRPKRRRLYKNAKNLKRTGGYFFDRFGREIANMILKMNFMPRTTGKTLRMRKCSDDK